MTTEPDICRRRHGGNQASEAAARGGYASRARQREWIYQLVRATGQVGMTTDEVAAAINALPAEKRANPARVIHPNDISGRMSELKAAGRLVRNEREPRRPTRSGAMAEVWVAKDKK